MNDWRPTEWGDFLDSFEAMGRKWDATYQAFRQGEYRNSLAAPMKAAHEAMCYEIGALRGMIVELEQEIDAHVDAL